MPLCHNVLDSASDEEIGWSRTLDLPRSRHAKKHEERRKAAAEANAGKPGAAKANSILLIGPARKKIKLEAKDPAENVETPEERRLNIANWPEGLLKKLMPYLPVDDRIRMRCTCSKLKSVVDKAERMITYEICIKRLDETEIGLYMPEHRKEGRFVIHNKKFEWTERPLLRTMPEMRRGMVNWTRHHRTRMGRIRTALKAIFKLSWILRINVDQINLSNSFIRDLRRIMNGGHRIHALALSCQMFEQERPDLTLLNQVPCKSLALSFRLKDREPLPHIERFLNVAIDVFSQIIIDVRQDSWKFRASLHYRKSYEEYGINDAALLHYMNGQMTNFLRLKVICRYITRDGIFAAIEFLRTRDVVLPSRGFSVLVLKEVAENLIPDLAARPPFGELLPNVDNLPGNLNGHKSYHTVGEYMEIRNVKQDAGKQPLTEVRYFRKGIDDDQEYITRRCDDDMLWDPFEQPKFLQRPA